MKKFLICFAPMALATTLFVVVEKFAVSLELNSGDWLIVAVLILIGLGSLLSGIFVGHAVFKWLKGPEWSRVLLGVLAGLATLPAYVAASFAGCAALSSIT